MSYCWILIFLVLATRFFLHADFKCIQITIYQVPKGPEGDLIVEKVRKGKKIHLSELNVNVNSLKTSHNEKDSV